MERKYDYDIREALDNLMTETGADYVSVTISNDDLTFTGTLCKREEKDNDE